MEKLIDSCESDMDTSPVMDRAVLLAARQYPRSCAVTDVQQASNNPAAMQNNLSRFIFPA